MATQIKNQQAKATKPQITIQQVIDDMHELAEKVGYDTFALFATREWPADQTELGYVDVPQLKSIVVIVPPMTDEIVEAFG